MERLESRNLLSAGVHGDVLVVRGESAVEIHQVDSDSFDVNGNVYDGVTAIVVRGTRGADTIDIEADVKVTVKGMGGGDTIRLIDTNPESLEVSRVVGGQGIDTLTSNTVVQVKSIERFIPVTIQGEQGEQGIQGETGATGEQGEPGQDGIDGIDGLNGLDGQDGAPGQDGIDGVDGVDGQDGAPGEPGPQGEPGVDGQDGETIYVEQSSCLSADQQAELTAALDAMLAQPGHMDTYSQDIEYLLTLLVNALSCDVA